MGDFFKILDTPSNLVDNIIESDSEVLKDEESFKFQVEDSKFGEDEETEITDTTDQGESEFVETETVDEPIFRNKGNGKNKSVDLDAEPTKKNFLNAKLNLGIYEMVITQIGKLASGETGEEADKKYRFSPADKKEVAKLWGLVLDQQEKVKSPSSQLNKMLIAHATMILLPAVLALISRKLKERKERKNPKPAPAAEPAQAPAATYEEVIVEQREVYTPPPIIALPEPAKAASKPKKTGSRGRVKGDKKNPLTGKMESPTSQKDGFNLYSWGVRSKIS